MVAFGLPVRLSWYHNVDAVLAVTVMRVLLFMLCWRMLRECEGDGSAGVGDG